MRDFDTLLPFKPFAGDPATSIQILPIWEPEVVSIPKARDLMPRSRPACDFEKHRLEEVIFIPVVDDNDAPTGNYWELRGEQITNVSEKIGFNVREAKMIRLSMLPKEVV